MATYAICTLIIAITTSHQVYGFSTPRTLTSNTKTVVLLPDVTTAATAWDNTSSKCIINGGRRVNGVCLQAETDDYLSSLDGKKDGDDDNTPKEKKEEEEPELETEASTTGLIIPGFSDKVVSPSPAPEEKPKPAPPEVKKVALVQKVVEQKKSEKKTDLLEDASESIIDLPSLPKISLPSFGGGGGGNNKKQPPPKPPSGVPGKKVEDVIASSLGGALTGVAAGLYADIATDVLMDTDLPPLVPPAALGVALGAGAFIGASQNNFIGSAVKFIFGKPILGIKNRITNKITETVDDIKSTPTRIKDAAVKKVDDTVDEIKATPGKIKDAAVAKVDETVDEIKVCNYSLCIVVLSCRALFYTCSFNICMRLLCIIFSGNSR